MSDTSGRRLGYLAIFVGALLVTLIGRLIELQFVRGSDLARAAVANGVRTVVEPAARGLIVDSSGRPLAANEAAVVVVADRAALDRQKDRGAVALANLARLVGGNADQLRQRLIPCGAEGSAKSPMCAAGGPSDPVTVVSDTVAAKVLPVAERPEEYPGLRLASRVSRGYPLRGVRAGHLLGYLGSVTAEDLKDTQDDADGSDGPRLTSADMVGRSGLEQQYDGELRGAAGERRVVVDSRGNVLRTEPGKDPIPGDDLITSINADLQAATERRLAIAVDNARRSGQPRASGSAVVLDVRTGRVLALASYPDYDPKLWVGGIGYANFRSLRKRGALLNHAVAGTSPPGSTFKPVTVLAMDRSGFDLGGSYECPASYAAGGRIFSNFENEALGPITLTRAIELSCNTVFYRVGDRLWRRGGGERHDPNRADPIADAASRAGLGVRTGLDLPGESSGVVAGPAVKYDLWQSRREAWCLSAKEGYPRLRRKDPAKADFYTALDRENCRTGNVWRQGDAINAAIGQGLTAVTPVQMAVFYSALANGGVLRSPTIGRAILARDGSVRREISPRVNGDLGLSGKARRLLTRAMTGVVSRGTARAAFTGFPLDKYPIAGKTGTAQVVGHAPTAWFASFAPAGSPRYAVVVSVDEGGTGGDAAAPVAAGIYSAIFGVGEKAVYGTAGPSASIPRLRAGRR